MSATDALNQYYKGCISSSVLLSEAKNHFLNPDLNVMTAVCLSGRV